MGEDLKNNTKFPEMLLLVCVSVSNGSGLSVSSKNVLRSVCGCLFNLLT